MNGLRFAVIGSPVAHSRSPAMHAAAYRALGLPHTYEAIETASDEVESRVEALRRGEFAGLNVTVPHKVRAMALSDDVDATARIAGAANTLVRGEGGRITAHNTDVPALAGELVRLAEQRGSLDRLYGVQLAGRSISERHGAQRSEQPVAALRTAPQPPTMKSRQIESGLDVFRGSTAIVLGAGGAARAAIVALASMLGVARIVVRDMTYPHHAFTAEMQEALSAHIGTRLEITAEPLAPARPEAGDLSAIVQATSCGMSGSAPGAIVVNAVGWDTAPTTAVALDVVYAPRNTPFVEEAHRRGLVSDNGLGMLARQGALAFALWLGKKAPFEIMRANLET